MKCSLYMNILNALYCLYTLLLVICFSFFVRKVFVQTLEGVRSTRDTTHTIYHRGIIIYL